MFSFLTDPLLKVLLVFYQFFGNFGFAILAFTAVLRALLIPLSIPMLKSQKKMQLIKPHLDKLKKQYGHDKAKLQQEQMKLYQEHKINPTAGCVPYLLQLVVLIALYQVLNTFLHSSQVNGVTINTDFFGLNLAKPDPTYILPILAGATQLIMSLMILPGVESHDLIPDTAKTKKLKEENKKESNTQEMAETIQKQTIFLMPAMTAFIALRFPSGLAMYWVATTVFSIFQQWIISGPGGLTLYAKKLVTAVKGKTA